jgi:hypothetical protein
MQLKCQIILQIWGEALEEKGQYVTMHLQLLATIWCLQLNFCPLRLM